MHAQPTHRARPIVPFILTVFLLLAAGTTAEAAGKKWWGGAAVGLSFGSDVSYFSVEPTVGYWFSKRLTAGGRVFVRYRDASGSDSQTDYGVTPFARFFVAKRFFVQGEYEWLSYERAQFGGGTERSNYDSFWAGGGYSQPLSKNSWFSVVAMYNLTWDDDETSPYSEPWVIRGGLGIRF